MVSDMKIESGNAIMIRKTIRTMLRKTTPRIFFNKFLEDKRQWTGKGVCIVVASSG